MANRRMITSAIWEDEWFGPLSYFGQALWIGLFSKCADDQGRLLDNARLIRAALFPYKDTSVNEIEGALEGFIESQRLHRYEARGKALLQIRTWWTHQRPQWANYSKWAPPPGWQDHVRTRLNGHYLEDNWLRQSGNAQASTHWSPSAGVSGDQIPEVLSQGPHLFGQYPVPDPDPVPDPVPDPAAAAATAACSEIPEQLIADILQRPITESDRKRWGKLVRDYGPAIAQYALNEALECAGHTWGYVATVAEAEYERTQETRGP
ncbi:MAG TPA: hypothetical protein VMX14_03610 [Anaerolineae bacterium]|nr:hypothetical protein [Anaerolineae bacterium]HUW13361.1 hypothetical protein [Anaerolineae bacterium]